MDQYESLRGVPLLEVMSLLGIDTSAFKKRSGKQEWYGKCVFHEGKNQSSFSFDSSLFHCFSCGVKGKGALDLVKAYRKCNFTDAVAFLQQSHPQQGISERTADQPQSRPETTENAPFKGSYEKFYRPCEWLTARIPDTTILERYAVGFYSNPSRKSAYQGKVMIPIYRFSDGEKVGYLARSIDGEPKYTFPRGFLKHLELYGAWQLSQGQALPLKLVYLVESCFSVMHFASLGFPAVSSFGWSVAPEQLQILQSIAKGVIYLPDRNKTEEGLKVAASLSRHLWARFPELPSGIDDPEKLTLEQIKAL